MVKELSIQIARALTSFASYQLAGLMMSLKLYYSHGAFNLLNICMQCDLFHTAAYPVAYMQIKLLAQINIKAKLLLPAILLLITHLTDHLFNITSIMQHISHIKTLRTKKKAKENEEE